MKHIFLIVAILMSVFCQAQKIDVKDARKYWVKDADTIVGSYSNNVANAIEKLTNFKLKYPNSNPKIETTGIVNVDVSKIVNPTPITNYNAPILDSIAVVNGTYKLFITQPEGDVPDSYEVSINDEIFYSNITFNELTTIYIDTTTANTFKVIPIYNKTALKSNQITINE